jgi:hypothetical protein
MSQTNPRLQTTADKIDLIKDEQTEAARRLQSSCQHRQQAAGSAASVS